ncbi:hypothetical protein PMIT1323_01339 [Prochlorococcus marinus str. MIT 1323]|nr:hypothetical protein PMIT1323_01339 [Prochlorococcus marinus str. MIT 1323]
MQKQTELTRDNVPHTTKIRFWTEGEMSQTAYKSMNEHRTNNREDLAKVVLSEWIL